MDREQIIQMARDAGIVHELLAPSFGHVQAIERFAAAIRAATKEEDARICDDVGMFHEFCAGSGLAFDLADKIRASK